MARVDFLDEAQGGLAFFVRRLHGVTRAGIDVPFGWPAPFVQALHDHRVNVWTADTELGRERRKMQQRATDLFVRACLPEPRRRVGILSVSTDRLGSTALVMARLEQLALEVNIEVDRSGRGKMVEVYPAATLASWDLPFKGYKSGDKKTARNCRENIFLALREKLDTIVQLDDEVGSTCIESDHHLDALICALTARAVQMGGTYLPDQDPPSGSSVVKVGRDLVPLPSPAEREALAATEGWIHVPKASDPAELLH